MERISIQELGDVFAARTKLAPKDAERLVKTMFALISDELAKGNQVKVRGLGTFKFIDVDSRESVNVTTGERIVIDGHEKLTFVPDATMKELVNRPFSQFETVVLNDGVDFSDVEMEDEDAKQPLPKDDNQMEEQPSEEEDTAELAEPPIQMVQVTVRTDISDDSNATGNVDTDETVGLLGTTDSDSDGESGEVGDISNEDNGDGGEDENPDWRPEDIDLSERQKDRREEIEERLHYLKKERRKLQSQMFFERILMTVACVGLVCCLVYAGYFYGRNKYWIDEEIHNMFSSKPEPVAIEKPKAVAPKTSEKETLSEKRPSSNNQLAKDVNIAEKTDSTPQQVKTDIYAERDARVRTGAYRIVGTDYEVSVKKGETLKKISERALGPDMECYVEVYNDITASTELKEGQKLKIPKLELKKKRKK